MMIGDLLLTNKLENMEKLKMHNSLLLRLFLDTKLLWDPFLRILLWGETQADLTDLLDSYARLMFSAANFSLSLVEQISFWEKSNFTFMSARPLETILVEAWFFLWDLASTLDFRACFMYSLYSLVPTSWLSLRTESLAFVLCVFFIIYIGAWDMSFKKKNEPAACLLHIFNKVESEKRTEFIDVTK